MGAEGGVHVGEQAFRERSLHTSATGPHGDQLGGSGQDKKMASPGQGHGPGECPPLMGGKVRAPALYLYPCPFLKQNLTKNVHCTEQM